jgi:hypothetical protein
MMQRSEVYLFEISDAVDPLRPFRFDRLLWDMQEQSTNQFAYIQMRHMAASWIDQLGCIHLSHFWVLFLCLGFWKKSWPRVPLKPNQSFLIHLSLDLENYDPLCP